MVNTTIDNQVIIENWKKKVQKFDKNLNIYSIIDICAIQNLDVKNSKFEFLGYLNVW